MVAVMDGKGRVDHTVQNNSDENIWVLPYPQEGYNLKQEHACADLE